MKHSGHTLDDLAHSSSHFCPSRCSPGNEENVDYYGLWAGETSEAALPTGDETTDEVGGEGGNAADKADEATGEASPP